MTDVANISTARLCGHHNTTRFECGNPELDAKLPLFQERFESGEKMLGFVAIDGAEDVLAYVILSDTTLVAPESGRRMRCFTVPAMAVASRHQGSSLFHALIERALNAMAVRQAGARTGGVPYQGLVCMPGDNKVLERWLVGWAQFKPLGAGLFWLPLGEHDTHHEW